MLKTPYLLFLGDVPDPLSAKVAQGIRDWRPEYALGQYRLPGCQADMKLPDFDIETAVAQDAKMLVIGAANRGGVISRSWIGVLKEALAGGMDIALGLHNLLRDVPELVEAAEKYGGRLIDVRVPQVQYPIGDGKRCLAVGTDCSIGKMYTALALDIALRELGAKSSFRATGQTGILITGEGVPVDAVIADFMAGSIEWLTPDNDDDHWDIIEGQGSLFHPSYSGVTMALIHGGQPDTLILCHEPTRTHMRGLPHFQLPTLEQLRDTALPLAWVLNPACQVVGVSVNTSGTMVDETDRYLKTLENRLGLPCVDPYRQGAERLAEAVLAC